MIQCFLEGVGLQLHQHMQVLQALCHPSPQNFVKIWQMLKQLKCIYALQSHNKKGRTMKNNQKVQELNARQSQAQSQSECRGWKPILMETLLGNKIYGLE